MSFSPASCSPCRELQNLNFRTSSCLSQQQRRGNYVKRNYIFYFFFPFILASSHTEQYSVYLCAYVQVCKGEHLLTCDLYKLGTYLVIILVIKFLL